MGGWLDSQARQEVKRQAAVKTEGISILRNSFLRMKLHPAFKHCACVLIFFLVGCMSFEIRDLKPASARQSLKAQSTIPLTVGISHLRDQMQLSNAESSVAVTLVFLELLRKSNLFDKVFYPVFQPSQVQLTFRIDFERKFDYHYFSNEGKNLLLLASVFLLSPFLKVHVDYIIQGRIDIEREGKVLKSYRGEAISGIYMPFFTSYTKAADQLSEKAMRSVSEKLLVCLLNDQSFFLADAVREATSKTR